MRRRGFLASAAGCISGALACPAIAQDQRLRTLRFVPNGAGLTAPDPVWTTAAVTGTHAQLVYDTLYGLDASNLPRPQMAAGHEIDDAGRRWVITLREGLLFHDGEPVRAVDAAASLRRWAQRDGFGQRLFAQVAQLRVLDDRRFELVLDRPFPLLLHALANGAFIMPERVAQTDPFQQITDYVGSGPWHFLRDEWVIGARSAYAKFDRYKPRQEPSSAYSGAKIAHFERVEWTSIPDPSTAVAALQACEVDWVEQPLFDLVPQIQRTNGLQLAVFNTLGRIGLVALNHLHPPFNNPVIRRAVLEAVNQDDYVAAVVGDAKEYGRTGVGFFTLNSPYASRAGLNGLLTGQRDTTALSKRIRDAGYKGERVVLLAPADMESIKAISQVTAAVFEAVGLNVDYISLDWGSLLARRANRNPPDQGGWNAHATTWTGLGMLNPATNTPLRANGPQAWSGWPDGPELERLREAWFDASDLPAQQEIARRIQQAAAALVPYLPVGEWAEPTALRANLGGLAKTSLAAFWSLQRI